MTNPSDPKAVVERLRDQSRRNVQNNHGPVRALCSEAAQTITELVARVEGAEAEAARLTLKPCEHQQYHSVVYRTGPLTIADYEEAIQDLERAKTALVEGDSMGCRVCEDSGHGANNCHHNPMLLARRWTNASRFWQCWHCGFIATTDAEGREHFGENEECEPACIMVRADAAEARALTLQSALDEAVGALERIAGHQRKSINLTTCYTTEYEELRKIATTTLASLKPGAGGVERAQSSPHNTGEQK